MRITTALPFLVLAACGPRAEPAPPTPEPEPPPPAVTARRRREIPPVDRDGPLWVCVLKNGVPRRVPTEYGMETGDTTVGGLPFSSVYPLTGEYASVAGWYVNDEPIAFRGHRFVKYGAPRMLGGNDVTRVGEYRGVGVYADAADTASAAAVVYLPTRVNCEFQPYVSGAFRK